jgi:triacylglycerol lipase
VSDQPPVVVLHGLGRTHLSMAGMARFLRSNGLQTWSRTYPSRRQPLPELASLVSDWILADLGTDARPMAVTHSLGGVLVRLMSSKIQFSRIVMLAPPNNGSQLATNLADLGLFQRVFGPAGAQIAAAEDWPLPPCPVAVVAGTLAPSIGNPVSWLSTGLRTFEDGVENDGTVTVNETKLPKMALFEQVPASHTWIMNHAGTRQLTLNFLRANTADSCENND